MDLDLVQSYLLDNHLDGWLLYDFRGQNSVALDVAGIDQSGSRRWFLWIPAQGRPVWLIHSIERMTFANVRPELEGDRHLYVGWQQLAEILPAVLGLTGGETPRIAMEYSALGALPYVGKVDAGTVELVAEITGADIVSSADLIQLVQAVLSPGQWESHRRAAAICLQVKDAAFDFIAETLAAGETVTEYEVQRFILDRFARADLDPDHPPIVAVNGNAAIPHYAPNAARSSPIRRGDMVLIDLWARERTRGACFADVTWVAYCGAEVPPEVSAVFEVVARSRDDAVEAIEEAVAGGKRIHGYEVDELARSTIQNAGYGAGILHRTGHSLGPQLHWNGVNIDNLETQDRRLLIPGVMFTIEPGVYLPDFNWDESDESRGLGIRSEINCIVHEDRLEVTTDRQHDVIPLLAD